MKIQYLIFYEILNDYKIELVPVCIAPDLETAQQKRKRLQYEEDKLIEICKKVAEEIGKFNEKNSPFLTMFYRETIAKNDIDKYVKDFNKFRLEVQKKYSLDVFTNVHKPRYVYGLKALEIIESQK